jgi:hypothetical protein
MMSLSRIKEIILDLLGVVVAIPFAAPFILVFGAPLMFAF